MPHEITHTNGVWEFAYAGTAPWHGLGQQLPAAATSQDIARAAGLEWFVIPEPIYLKDGSTIPGWVANQRSDTHEVLGVVSTDYRIVQNGEWLAFTDSLVGEAVAMYHTAGSLRGGRRVFATAKLPTSTMVVPNDAVDHYLLVTTAHDGTMALSLRFTGVRVVCANTLRAAMSGGAAHEYTIRHIGSLAAQMEEARRALGIAHRYFDVAGQAYKAMSATQLSAAGLEQFVTKMLPVMTLDAASSEDAQRQRSRTLQARDHIMALYAGGLGTSIPGVQGTVWGAYNAGIEWIDRVRTARQDGELRKGAAEAAVFGPNAQAYRQRAFDVAMALVRGDAAALVG
jgi:phage/plasmid-like protein (TIGR03299 family)